MFGSAAADLTWVASGHTDDITIHTDLFNMLL
jgi:fructose-1,6-bisphosphatase/inositol monophosphatase family enzyme